MVINYDIEKINSVLLHFHNLTGINMVLVKDDFTYIDNFCICESNGYCTQIKKAGWKPSCAQSDRFLLEKCQKTKQVEMHICHAGLIEIAVPILHNDIPICYILFGQMRTSSDFSAVADYLRNLGMDPKVMEELYSNLSCFDSKKIESVCNLASIIVNHILTENMIKQSYDDKITKAIAFIDQNLEKELTIQTISKGINVSKSVLYKCFHSHFGCTISEYINTKRVEKSGELLAKTNLSIEDISQKCGFLSASYYSKVFKRLKNTTPMKYRREHQRPAEK